MWFTRTSGKDSNKLQLLIMTISLLATSASFAAANQAFSSAYNMLHAGRMVVALGGGAVMASDVGQSQNFPIVNPITDAFYNYTANNPTQTKAGFNSFAGGEWKLYPQWALQVGLGFNGAGNFKAKGTLLQGADLQSSDQYTYQYSISTRQVLATSKLLYVYKNHFYPYAILGLGAAFNKAYNYTTTVPPFLTFTRVYDDNTQVSFSYQVGVGVDMDVAPHVRAGLGYRFADLGSVQLGNAIVNTTNVSGTLVNNHLYANELLAQLTWIM